MQTITTIAMRDAFAAAIRGITPTAAPLRVIGWSYTPSARAGRRAVLPAAMRNFDLMFRDPAPTHAWRGGRGTAYKVTLAVATSYAGVEPELREHLVTEDAVDIHRELRRLINTPAMDGLCEIEFVGPANERAAEAAYYIEHTFTVHYHQATR